MRINGLIAVAITSLALASPAVLAQFSKSTVSSQISSQFPDNTTGQITPATTRAFLNNLLNSYQQYAAYNKQVGATYTIQLSDYGQVVQFNGGNQSVTLSPANSSGYTTFNFYADNISNGNVVITPTGGSTICDATSLTLINSQSAWIISDGTNWQCRYGLAGSLLLPLGTSGHTIPVNDLGFTQTGNVALSGANSLSNSNFIGTFQVNSNTITWPAAAITVARTDAGQTFTGVQSFANTVAASGGMFRSTYGSMTIANGTCGAGNNGTVTGTNQVGLIGIGTAATTSCVISFGNTLANAPNGCVLFPNNLAAAGGLTTNARISAISITSFNLVGSVLSGANYYYHCQ